MAHMCQYFFRDEVSPIVNSTALGKACTFRECCPVKGLQSSNF